MKFMLLVRVLPGAEPTSEEADPSAWIADGTRRGMWLEGHRLREVSDATTVRLRDGKTVITDGPFADVAEHIAGFDVIEAAGIEDAVALAERHPMARYGAIEVREVREEFEHAGTAVGNSALTPTPAAEPVRNDRRRNHDVPVAPCFCGRRPQQ